MMQTTVTETACQASFVSLPMTKSINCGHSRVDAKHQLTFCESVALLSLAKLLLGSTVPRKIGLNWFIPALANSRVGSLWGTTLLEGTWVWPLVWKNSMNAARTLSPVHSRITLSRVSQGVASQGQKLED